MTENEMKQIEGLFTHQLGIFAEDVQHKFDLVIEGQQLLSERMDHMKTELKSDIDRVHKRLTSVDGSLIKKIDGVKSVKVYKIREGPDFSKPSYSVKTLVEGGKKPQ